MLFHGIFRMTMESASISPLSASHSSGKAVLSRKAIWLDAIERIIITAVFCRFAFVTLQNFSTTANIVSLLMFISEMLPFVLILFRAPSATLSDRPTDWLFGLGGTLAPLLVTPAPQNPLVSLFICFAIIVAGFFIQVAAKVALGRSFGIIAANRGVKVIGPYRFVRHPMYAGYAITHIGFLLAMPSLINALFYATALGFQIFRILREERVLNQAEQYQAFAAHVRYRLVPGVF